MTDQCTYTGRWDKLRPVPIIRHEPSGASAFELQGEDNLARKMRGEVAILKARQKNYKTLEGRLLKLMKPGREYTAAELADRINKHSSQSIGTQLTRMKAKGIVTCEALPCGRFEGGGVVYGWRLAG